MPKPSSPSHREYGDGTDPSPVFPHHEPRVDASIEPLSQAYDAPQQHFEPGSSQHLHHQNIHIQDPDCANDGDDEGDEGRRSRSSSDARWEEVNTHWARSHSPQHDSPYPGTSTGVPLGRAMSQSSQSTMVPRGVLKNSGRTYRDQDGESGSLSNNRSTTPRVALTDPMGDMRERNIDPITGGPCTSPKSSPESPSHKAAASAKAQDGYFDTPSPSQTLKERQKTAHSIMSNAEAVLPLGEDNKDDEFCWSNDEAVEEAAKFEEQMAHEHRVRIGRFSLEAIYKFMCYTFLGNLIISIILIFPVLGMSFGYRPGASDQSPDAQHRRYVADNVDAWFIWASFNLHLSWWLHAMIALFPRLITGGIRLVWGSVSQQVNTVAEGYNALRPAINPIFYAAAGWASWVIIFSHIFNLFNANDPSNCRASYMSRGYQINMFYFFVTLTYCVEQMLIILIAINFHKTAHCDRIAEVTNALKVFDTLQDHRPRTHKRRVGKENPTPGGAFHPTPELQSTSRSGFNPGPPDAQTPGSESVSIDMATAEARSNTPTLSDKNSSSQKQPAEQYPHERHHGRRLRTLHLRGYTSKFGSKASSMRAKSMRVGRTKAMEMAKVAVQNPFDLLSSNTVGVSLDINSPDAAKRLARSIFMSFRGSKRAYLIPSDFERAYPTPAAAEAAFRVFDRDGNGDVSPAEVKNTVLCTYKERRMLSRSMMDVNNALHQLNLVFLCVVAIVVVFEALGIFQVDIHQSIQSFYSLVIAFSFIFKESAANLFDSIIFLFVTHPFDTGDRICFVGADGTPIVLLVKQMSLLSSTFVQSNNAELFVTNSLLSNIVITNFRRSGYQAETATLQLAFNTPQDKLDAVENDMNHWLSTEPKRMFLPSTSIIPVQFNNMRSVEVSLTMTHRHNWQDYGSRWTRRTAFIAALLFYCKKHKILYSQADLPIVYSPEELTSQCAPPAYHVEDHSRQAAQTPLPRGSNERHHQGSDAPPRRSRPFVPDRHGTQSEEELLESLQQEEQRRSQGVQDQRRRTFNFRGDEVSSLYDHSFDEAVRAAMEGEGASPTQAEAGHPALRPDGPDESESHSTGTNARASQAGLPASAALLNFLPPADEFGGNSVMRRRRANKEAQRLAAAAGG